MRQLTHKQKEFIKHKAQGKTGKQAVIDAGYNVSTPNTAEVIAYENLRKPQIASALDKALVKHEITLDAALKPISKGLIATRQNEFTGEITEDINTQLKASDRALRLLGVSQGSSQTAFVNVINIDRDKYKL